MKVTVLEKIKLIFGVYSILNLLPTFKKKVSIFFRPIDAVRYIEFGYIRKFIRENRLSGMDILDLSSPYTLSYYLSKNNKVIKTDIDSKEKSFIKENKNLIFKLEDATAISFTDNTFDFVYSISVIEHIYNGYTKAISEMIRVVKEGGYVYVTFPVASIYKEEWVKGEVYEMQHKEGGKTFFQYRFDESHTDDILKEIKKHDVTIVHKDIFWESRDGMYDALVEKIKHQSINPYINFIKNVYVNFWYGFRLFEVSPVSNFSNPRSLGNMHLILKKNSNK